MKGTLPIKALSINQAFQGRRFKTKECNTYCKTLALMLPHTRIPGEYYQVWFRFYLKNFAMTDEDNLVKLLQDCMVQNGMIVDDRRIVRHILEKFPADIDRIEWEILATEKPI
jgi:Holliday junction resolvase RusA-like endonuclease